MSYSTSNQALASDYNTHATNLNDVYGVGTGSFGYGQTGTLNSVTAGKQATGDDWSSLKTVFDKIAAHTGQSVTALSFTAGNQFAAVSTLAGDITNLRSSRLSATDLADTSALTPTASATWSTLSTLIFTVTFASSGSLTAQDVARAWFNTGGQIRISISKTNGGTGATSGNTSWDNLCTAAGTLAFGANSFAKVGGSGTPTTLNTGIGYYQLTTSNQTLFKQFDTVTAYTANYLQLDVKTDTVTDPNSRGGVGSTLTFTLTFADAHVETVGQVIDGTITVSVFNRHHSGTNLPTIYTPTFATTSFTQS